MGSDKTEKKRKRDSDRHERPSKKPALAPQNLPPLKASVLRDDSEFAPVLVHTPGLQYPRKVQGFKPYIRERNEPVAKVSSSDRNKGINSTELLLQSSEHPKLDFVGREANDDADSLLNHYIAIVDPKKKTWEFVEVRKMTLRSSVKRNSQSTEIEEDGLDMEGDGTTTSYRDQKDALTAAFGTKASRKAQQSLAENSKLAPAGASKAAESAIISSMPSDAIASANSKTDEMQAQIQANKPIPTPNLSVEHPSEVYAISSLVPGGLSTLSQLPVQEWQEAVETGTAITSTSRYVAHRVEAVVQSTNTTHLQLLRLILALLEFNRSLKRGKQSDPQGSRRLPLRADLKRLVSAGSSAEVELPDPVIEAIRRRFAPRGVMTRTDVTLLHTTICALTLHIPPVPTKDGGTSSLGGNAPNELATDPADLRDDLRTDNQGIVQYFRELGCKVDKPRDSEFEKWAVKTKAEANLKRVCRLRLPVEFPRLARGKATRR